MTLPNLVSVARALAVVPVIALLGAPDATAAVVLFTLAALTDAIDGPLARRLRATSAVGAFLDPLADKVLVLGTLAGLVARAAADPLAVGLILTREAIVTGVRAVAAGRGATVPSARLGRAKAFVQGLAVVAALAAISAPSLGAAAGALLWSAAILTVASGVDIVRRAADILASAPAHAHAR